jgi:hypothetical protein
MKPFELISSTVVELTKAYREAAIAHVTASATGRHRVANRNYDLLEEVRNELLSRGAGGEHQLVALMDDAEPAVQLWAASHSLEIASLRAELVLESLSTGPPSPLRLTAETTLRQWRAERNQ